MWTLLPHNISHKFQEALQVTYPRLTAGYSGLTTVSTEASIILDDPQSISSVNDNTWTQPPETRRPPRYVSVIYKEEAQVLRHNEPRTSLSDNKSKISSSDKSQTTTRSESELSTLVSSIREDMNREFQAHTEIISALKEEISQLRNRTIAETTSDGLDNPTTHTVIQSLRQEIQELKQAIPSAPPNIPDLAQLITSVVENMVPLITAAVRQGLTQDPPEPSKRSRHGTTPTQFRGKDILPINLMDSYPPSPPDPHSTTFTERPTPPPRLLQQSPSNSNLSAREGEDMIE